MQENTAEACRRHVEGNVETMRREGSRQGGGMAEASPEAWQRIWPRLVKMRVRGNVEARSPSDGVARKSPSIKFSH